MRAIVSPRPNRIAAAGNGLARKRNRGRFGSILFLPLRHYNAGVGRGGDSGLRICASPHRETARSQALQQRGGWRARTSASSTRRRLFCAAALHYEAGKLRVTPPNITEKRCNSCVGWVIASFEPGDFAQALKHAKTAPGIYAEIEDSNAAGMREKVQEMSALNSKTTWPYFPGPLASTR
ncbi:MAG: hypothetical protein ONB53_21815 [candidate division KSB1 bacterium]|nr:hypothetical protein [candidate division KSB1 bacterium]MDZ7300460.1 hypothetical protein [candidate division KSB1 bacterium]MDZ7308638.1 hypothetical protein [candidate division KSB1 bacterium]MDZ7351438.1 hypothetical protein [candidate division KSB1 bacterium]MDZ7355797.1 hypothetical protein [candidate division KSB1 bacterium]